MAAVNMDLRHLPQAISRLHNHPLARKMFAHGRTLMASIQTGTRYGMRLLSKLALRTGLALVTAMIMLPYASRLFKRFAHLFNGIPGPVLPKLSGFWKVICLYRGTYIDKLREIHRNYGLVVQIAPNEYSVSDISALPYWWKLEKSSTPDTLPLLSLHPNAARLTHAALAMPSIYHYEPQIDQCNLTFLKSLLDSATQGDSVDLTALIQRYAFDVLFAVSTGKHAGFLHGTADIATLVHALDGWKQYSVATGSATRLLPRVAQFLRHHDIRNDFEQVIHDKVKELGALSLGCTIDGPLEDDATTLEQAVEACTAMVLAGTDPLITHLQSSLFHIYNDKDLLEQLREEITNAHLSQPPTIKELVYGTLNMPLLHAVLRESLRLQDPHTNGVRLLSPKGGVVVVDVLIPEDSIICLEPSIVNLNKTLFGEDSETFNPQRWLAQPALAREVSEHMISFGAGTSLCPGRHLHTAIIIKILTQTITHFDIEMAPNLTISTSATLNVGNALMNIKTPKTAFFDSLEYVNCPSTPLKCGVGALEYILAIPITATAAPDATISTDNNAAITTTAISAGDDVAITNSTSPNPAVKGTNISFHDFLDLECNVDSDDAKAIKARFEPGQVLTPRPMLKLKPIEDNHRRARTHQILERIYGDSLIHETASRTREMHLWVPGSKIPNWLSKLHAHRSKTPLIRANSNANAISNHTNGPAAYPKKTFQGTGNKSTFYNTKPNGYQGQPALRASRMPNPDTHDKAWLGFAVNANKKYADDIEKFSNPAPRPSAPALTVTFNETFKAPKAPPKVIAEAAKEAAPPAERKLALPPHLRNKAAAADAA